MQSLLGDLGRKLDTWLDETGTQIPRLRPTKEFPIRSLAGTLEKRMLISR